MVILLAGSSQLGRSAIATRLVKEDKQWRHLPLEELAQMDQIGEMDIAANPDVMLRIACQCAMELQDQGFNLIISCDYAPSAAIIVQDELGQDVIPIHIGSEEELERSEFPHRVDANKSTIGEVHTFLHSFLPPT